MTKLFPRTDSRSMILISEPCIFNPSVPNKGCLGDVLQRADLVTETQILLAFQEQGRYADLKIGEILALRGWIAEKTADFFAERWPRLLAQEHRYPLGYYLKEAGLLNEEQIDRVLAEQEELWLRFGAVAVRKGWLKQTTLDFFLRHLFPEECSGSIYRYQQEDLDGGLNPRDASDGKSAGQWENPSVFSPDEDEWEDDLDEQITLDLSGISDSCGAIEDGNRSSGVVRNARPRNRTRSALKGKETETIWLTAIK